MGWLTQLHCQCLIFTDMSFNFSWQIPNGFQTNEVLLKLPHAPIPLSSDSGLGHLVSSRPPLFGTSRAFASATARPTPRLRHVVSGIYVSPSLPLNIGYLGQNHTIWSYIFVVRIICDLCDTVTCCIQHTASISDRSCLKVMPCTHIASQTKAPIRYIIQCTRSVHFS